MDLKFLRRLKFTIWKRKEYVEFWDFFKILQCVLKVFGYAHHNRFPTTFREKFHATKRNFLSFLGRLTLILSMIVYLIWIVENRNDLMGLLRAIPSITSNTFVATRYFTIYHNRNRIRIMYEKLFGVYEDLQLKHSKMARNQLRTTKILQSYGIFLLIFTQLSQIVDFATSYIRHGTDVFNVQIWLPFEHNTNLTYFMSCLWITWSGLFCSSALYIGDWTVYSIITVASVEFRMVGKKFKEILSDRNVTLEDLGPIINYHNRIINVCNNLENIMSKALLHNCLQTTVIICLICFQIVILKDPTQLINFLRTCACNCVEPISFIVFSWSNVD